MSRPIRLIDLKTAHSRGINAHLYCPKCQGQYSAHPGDYWLMPADHVFKCCLVNNLLVTETRVLREVG